MGPQQEQAELGQMEVVVKDTPGIRPQGRVRGQRRRGRKVVRSDPGGSLRLREKDVPRENLGGPLDWVRTQTLSTWALTTH